MSTDISAENEAFLREAIKNGRFESKQQALDEGIRLLRKQAQGDEENGAKMLSLDEWVAEYDAWVKRHKPRNPNMDDSRDSIYPDRI